jgi:hypothetical protein
VTVVSIVLNCPIRSGGPMICTQPELKPSSARFSSEKLSSPFSCSHSPRVTGSKAIPNPLRRPYAEIFCDVLADVAAHRGARVEERVRLRRRSVGVQAQDHARQVGVVGLGPAEPVVVDAGAEGADREVLELPAAAGVADLDVQLPVARDAEDAAVAVPAQRPASAWNDRSLIRFMSNVSVEPFQTYRSMRLPSSGTSSRVSESTPPSVSLQNRNLAK